MLDFHMYLVRYGEFGVQALIERLEKYEQVKAHENQSLEDRWNALMRSNDASVAA